MTADGADAAAPNIAPVIITVHGTNDALPEAHGQQWWQIGSPFQVVLARELARRGVPDAEIVPHQWSGANSDADRLRAASALAKRIGNLGKAGRPIALIGHSHGGNIVMEAVTDGATGKHVRRVATFGTPFFRRKLKLVPWLIAAFQILLGVVITPIMIGYMVLILGTEAGPRIEAAGIFLLIALAAIFALRAGIRTMFGQRLARWNAKRNFNAAHWMAIHSPRDEAMRVLEAAADLKPRYVTVDSARRSIDAFASLVGVVGTAGVFAWFGSYFLAPILSKTQAGEFGFATLVDFSFLLLVPIVFAVITSSIRLAGRLGGAWLYARVLNLLIHGGVVGAAYGGDAAYHLTGVARTPPTVSPIMEMRIEALNLGGIDDRAIFDAAHKLYDGIVAMDEAEGGIGDPDAMWKRLSDSLYHNAYMRDDRVAATVAEHLAAGIGPAGRNRAARATPSA
jgi:hypothetical protein